MKLRILAVALAAVTLTAMTSHAAPAAGVRDDSTVKLDLTAVDKGVYFVMCETLAKETTKEVSECARLSVWEDTNAVRGLQSTPYFAGGISHKADAPLLG